MSLLYLGRLNEAFSSFDKATDIDPNDATSWYFMGYILEKLGRVEDAKRAYSISEEIKNER